jgi:hypothetical protein
MVNYNCWIDGTRCYAKEGVTQFASCELCQKTRLEKLRIKKGVKGERFGDGRGIPHNGYYKSKERHTRTHKKG